MHLLHHRHLRSSLVVFCSDPPRLLLGPIMTGNAHSTCDHSPASPATQTGPLPEALYKWAGFNVLVNGAGSAFSYAI